MRDVGVRADAVARPIRDLASVVHGAPAIKLRNVTEKRRSATGAMMCSHSRRDGTRSRWPSAAHRTALPALLVPTAQAKPARRQERQRDDVLEHGLVAMPSDRGPGAYSVTRTCCRLLRRHAREVRRTFAQASQARDLVAWAQSPSRRSRTASRTRRSVAGRESHGMRTASGQVTRTARPAPDLPQAISPLPDMRNPRAKAWPRIAHLVAHHAGATSASVARTTLSGGAASVAERPAVRRR